MNFMKKALFASLAVSATFSQENIKRVIFKAIDVPTNEKITLLLTDGKNNQHESILNYENGSKKMIDLEKSKDSGIFIKTPGVYLKNVTIRGVAEDKYNNKTVVGTTIVTDKNLKTLNDSLAAAKNKPGQGQPGFIIKFDKSNKKYDITPKASVSMLD